MTLTRVLIVEDNFLIAMDVEQQLLDAGFEVCGIAASETEALDMASRQPPDLAVVDVDLAPGDGRVVAKVLHDRYGAAVLFATGQCDELKSLQGSGAVACLPKPYRAELVPTALRAVCRIAEGQPQAKLPDGMFPLAA